MLKPGYYFLELRRVVYLTSLVLVSSLSWRSLIMSLLANALRIYLFASLLSLLIPASEYRYYLYLGVIFLAFFTAVYEVIEEMLIIMTRVEMHLYIFSLPLGAVHRLLGVALGSSVWGALTVLPYMVLAIAIYDPSRLLVLPSIFSVMVLTSAAMGGLIGSLVMSVKRRWLYTIASVITANFGIRLSTSLYPITSIPEVFRLPALANPITYYADLFHRATGVDPELLLNPVLAVPALVSVSASLVVAELMILRRFSEGGRF